MINIMDRRIKINKKFLTAFFDTILMSTDYEEAYLFTLLHTN